MKTKKGRSFRPFFYLLLVTPIVASAYDGQLTVELDSNSYSPATSLASISGKWNDRVVDGGQAWSLSRLMLGMQAGAFSLQAIFRDDTFYRFANDTAEFVYLTKNHLALETGEDFRLFISADKASSRGLRFGYHPELSDSLKVSAWVSLLQPQRLTIGSLDGSAHVLGSNDYDFNFNSDLLYDEDPLYGREAGSLDGFGYSFDLSAQYTINDHWQLDLQLLDMFGVLDIDQAPVTIATATSQIKQYDEDGYLRYDPVVSGQDSYRDYRYRFEPQLRLKVVYQLTSKHNLVVEHRRVYGFDYQKIMLEQPASVGKIRWSWIVRMNALGLAWVGEHFSIAFESDRLNAQKMKYLSLSTSYYWPF